MKYDRDGELAVTTPTMQHWLALPFHSVTRSDNATCRVSGESPPRMPALQQCCPWALCLLDTIKAWLLGYTHVREQEHLNPYRSHSSRPSVQ